MFTDCESRQIETDRERETSINTELSCKCTARFARFCRDPVYRLHVDRCTAEHADNHDNRRFAGIL